MYYFNLILRKILDELKLKRIIKNKWSLFFKYVKVMKDKEGRKKCF